MCVVHRTNWSMTDTNQGFTMEHATKCRIVVKEWGEGNTPWLCRWNAQLEAPGYTYDVVYFVSIYPWLAVHRPRTVYIHHRDPTHGGVFVRLVTAYGIYTMRDRGIVCHDDVRGRYHFVHNGIMGCPVFSCIEHPVNGP